MLNFYSVNLARMFPVDSEMYQAIALENRILKRLLIMLFPLGKKKKRKKGDKSSLNCYMMIVTVFQITLSSC